MLLKDRKILLGRRHANPQKADSELYGEDSWTMSGGKVNFGDSLKVSLVREVSEETSLQVAEDDLKLISVSDDIVEDAHFVTIGFLCEIFQGEPKVMEPDEIVEWKWFSVDDLPWPMFFLSE
ncbi:MAG: NUDIX domain-containing protein [Patescibacteria group bacterium]|nr:NUDIX domain-containing protein [Patescibacteria group bacterium]